MSWIKRYIKRNKKDFTRSLIVLVAAIVLGFLAVTIAQLLEKPINSYYPHDEVRGGNIILWENIIETVINNSNEIF